MYVQVVFSQKSFVQSTLAITHVFFYKYFSLYLLQMGTGTLSTYIHTQYQLEQNTPKTRFLLSLTLI